jgi:hypothetical protein
MPVSYVDISREELEDWLDSLPYIWTREPRMSGIYYIHLSDAVAIKLSSTQTASSGSMGYAEGSMKLSLVSLVTKQLLNKKDADRSHFKRTLNWKKTWKDGVEHWASVYKNAKDFYDRIAIVEDRAEYKRNLLKDIESVYGWDKNVFLSSMHEKVSNNSILTKAQEEAIAKFVKNRPIVSRPAPMPPVSVQKTFTDAQSAVRGIVFTPEQERAMNRLVALTEVASPIDKTYTLIMINKARQGIKLTSEEKQKLLGLLKDYNIR